MKDMYDSNDSDDLEIVDEDTGNTTETELEDIEENSVQKIKKLKEQLKDSEKEKMEHLENLQRAKAEFLNGKRRLEEERVKDKERAVNDLIEKLLPMSDSFTMAQSNKAAWEAIDPTWRKGVESIQRELQTILTSYGVQEVDPTGMDFNPNEHEAMANMPVTDKVEHQKVLQVVQKGFVRMINGTEILIRPARVIVGEFSERETNE